MTRAKSAQNDDRAETNLLEYIGRPGYEPLTQRQLLHRLQVEEARRPAWRRLIGELIEQGKLVKLSRGRLAAAPAQSGVTGRLQRHRDGYGFVAREDGGADLFIPPNALGDAVSGDRVLVRLSRRGRSERLEAEIQQIIERRSRELLGLFVARGREATVHPFDATLAEPIRIASGARGGAEHDQVVRVELLRPSGRHGGAEGRVLEVLGRLDDPGMDVAILAAKYELDLEHDPATLDAAVQLPARVGPRETARRERFDEPPPITIDGETARDFDDAIAVTELHGGGYRLFVHIADVAHFVAVDDVLDTEARRRGTSVYFPDRVLPMFPEKLSNDLCSLRPGVDRLVHSVILDFDEAGRRRNVRFADGVIRSAARLTYGQVAAVLDGEGRVAGVPERLLPMLRCADALRQRLEQRRKARGSVDLDLPEPQLLLDVEGVMTGVTVEPRNLAHRLIEECMLAANEAVAAWLTDQESPCMFRVHEAPDPAKFELLERFARSLGADVPEREGPLHPRHVAVLLEPFENRPEYRTVSQVALRSMSRARYAMDNVGHFGLAASHYCHFTSPIRRYPDLLVHRLLRARRRKQELDEGWVAQLPGVALSASALERNAEAAERELLLRKKVAFIADHVGETFEGIVTGVASFGLFVELTENLVEGLLRTDVLGAERFEFLENSLVLQGTRSGTRYRLGDRLRVRVDRVDRILQRVDFSPADRPPVAAERRARPSRRPRGRGAAGRGSAEPRRKTFSRRKR